MIVMDIQNFRMDRLFIVKRIGQLYLIVQNCILDQQQTDEYGRYVVNLNWIAKKKILQKIYL